MKLFNILTASALLALPLTSCDKASESTESNQGTPAEQQAEDKTTHDTVIRDFKSAISEMTNAISAITTVEDSEKAAAVVKTIPEKVRPVIEAAEKLPAPSAEKKAAIDADMDAFGKTLMAPMMKLSELDPEIAKPVAEALEAIDSEMEALSDRFGAIYKVEDN